MPATNLDIRYYERNDLAQQSAKASDKADALLAHNAELASLLANVRGGAALRKKVARASRLAVTLAALQDEIYRELRD